MLDTMSTFSISASDGEVDADMTDEDTAIGAILINGDCRPENGAAVRRDR